MAWLYVYGGANEATVFNDRLRNDLFQAQKQLNIFGGEIVNTELLPVLQAYVKEIKDGDYYNPPEWVKELGAEYGIRAYEKRISDL